MTREPNEYVTNAIERLIAAGVSKHTVKASEDGRGVELHLSPYAAEDIALALESRFEYPAGITALAEKTAQRVVDWWDKLAPPNKLSTSSAHNMGSIVGGCRALLKGFERMREQRKEVVDDE